MEINHLVQIKILKELLFNPNSKFSGLNITKLDNNHFNFHLKHLVDLKLIKKDKNIYQLTPEGLELAGRIDTKSTKFLRQPKVGVCIFVKNNEGRILLGKRLKDPGKGKYYFFTKKLEFNKSIINTASECLKQETGLSAEFTFAGNVRHMRHDYDVHLVCLKAIKISGILAKTTKESKNNWFLSKEIHELDDLYDHFFEEIDLFNSETPFFREFSM